MLALAGAGALAISAVAALAPGGPAARASTYNAPVVTSGTTYSPPAIAQIGNDVVIAARGAGSYLDLYWQVNGTAGWNKEIVGGYGSTYSAPSLAQDGTAVVISAQGPSDSLDFYWAVNGNSTWNPEVVAGAGTTGSAPAMVAQGGGVNIVAVNGNGYGSVFYWALNGSPTWHADTMPTGDTTQSSIVASPGGVHIAAAELFGYLVDNTDVNGSGTFQLTTVAGPNGLSGLGPRAATPPSITMNGGLVNITDEDDSGNLNFYWQDSSGTFHSEVVDTAANL